MEKAVEWLRVKSLPSEEFSNMGHRVVRLLAEYLDPIEETRVFPDSKKEPGFESIL